MFGNKLDAFPAFGRSYETVEEALADWNAGKDFRQVEFPGAYFSNRDGRTLKLSGITEVVFHDAQRGELGRVFL